MSTENATRTMYKRHYIFLNIQLHQLGVVFFDLFNKRW